MLLNGIASITEYPVVASVVWNLSGASGRRLAEGTGDWEFYGPHWGVGYYKVGRIPEEEVGELEGIPFAFDSAVFARLEGATLDYSEGQFVVIEHVA